MKLKTETFAKASERRLLALDQIIRRSGRQGVTREEILAQLHKQGFSASQRNLTRDRQKLRELGAPLTWDYRDGSDSVKTVHYSYSDPTWTISEIPMTEGTLFALLVSQRVMEQFSGLPLARGLKDAFNSIADSFNRKVAVHHNALVPISFSRELAPPVDPKVWAEVSKAAMKHRRLKITYRKGWNNDEGEESTRKIVPYHIVNLQGSWYLLASRSLEDDSLRQYSFTRITSAKALAHHAEPPEWFDVNRVLNNSFGQFIGDPNNIEEIYLRFSKRIAPLIMSRQYSSSEKKRILPNGEVELRLTASPSGPWPYYHVKSWILSWGSDVIVIGPDKLKKAVRDDIKKAAGLYENV